MKQKKKLKSEKSKVVLTELFASDSLILGCLPYLIADFLENGNCLVYDKKKSLFANEIAVVKEGSQVGPLCGGGGRKFYVNNILIHETMDWIS